MEQTGPSAEPAHRRTERRLAAQYAASRVLAEASNLAEASRRLLQEVAEQIGWHVACMWAVDPAGGTLRFVDLWHADQIRAEEFEAASRGAVFMPGQGLPGRVWERNSVIWIEDVDRDPNFPRSQSAIAAGLHGAFCFPIRLRGQVLGAIELFNVAPQPRDEALLEAMDAVGGQIGQFVARARVQEEVRSSEARKSAILEAAIDCIVAMDHEGRITEFNPAAEATFGYRRADVLGKELADLLIPPSLREEHRRGLAGYLRAGVGPILGRRVEMTAMRADGSEFPVELAVTRVDLPGPPLFKGFIRDITERKQAEETRRSLLEAERRARSQAEAGRERLAFLAEAGKILSASLNQERTLSKIARLVVPRLADWCVVYGVDPDGAIRRVALEHLEPSEMDVARAIRGFPIDPDAPVGVPKVLRTGEPELWPEADAELLSADVRDPGGLRKLIEPLGIRSWMCVPLIARDRTLGAISFIATGSRRAYGPEDLALAEELCAHAAVAIDNARLYEERSHIARILQRSLLPPSLPRIPGAGVAARYEAAGEGMQVGGDFYDLFQRPAGDWLMVVGDVQGKGPEAAALTGLARHTIRAVGMEEESPRDVLRLLNEAILREQGAERFCTVVCVRLRSTGGGIEVTAASGGHPLPRILRVDGTVESLGRHGTLLGLFADPDLNEVSSELAPGESIVLFSDGVIEHREGEDAEQEMDALLAKHAGEDAESIATALERGARAWFTGEARDDVAIMVLRADG